MTTGPLELVEIFLRLVDTFDFDGVRRVCTPNATVWHNDGKGEEPLTTSAQNMKLFSGRLESMRYEVIRQFIRGDEVLQQHVLHLVSKDGEVREVHAAMYFRFVDGLLDRIEEYANVLPPQVDSPLTRSK